MQESLARNYIAMEFPNQPENVGVARIAVAALAAQLDFTLEEVDEIKVATSEAVSNAILHGYRGRTGIVRVRAEVYAERLEVVVQDEGQGIADVELARQPSYSTDPERMGLGFVFMESFMDELEIDSAPGRGTRVRMAKVPQRKKKAAEA